MTMDPRLYAKRRRALGSRVKVAAELGVHPETIARRERGETPLREEHRLALMGLPMVRWWTTWVGDFPTPDVPHLGEVVEARGGLYVVTQPLPEAHALGTRWAVRCRPLECEPDEPEWVYLDEITTRGVPYEWPTD